jgi:Peptidase family M23
MCSSIGVMIRAYCVRFLTALVIFSAVSAHAADVPLAASLPIKSVVLMGATPSLGARIPFIGDGAAHLAYELYVTNFGRKPARIVALRVHGSGGAAFDKTIDGDALKSSFIATGSADRRKPEDPLLAPGASGIIYIFLDFASRETPAELRNSLEVEPDGVPADAQMIPLAPLQVEKPDAAPTIGAPFTGDRWQAANGPSNVSSHRRAVIVLDGDARSPERYAIDWIKLGDDGNTFSGDEHLNSSYHAYDVPVTAVADGRVVEMMDGLAENTPHEARMAIELTPSTMAGNNIVEDIGGGRYVGYAHFRPGTITVKNGDTVHQGQMLGKLGNSGNSTEPHLHLQICDAPSFLACNGLPMQFKDITLTKYRIEKKGETPIRLTLEGAPRNASGQEPMEDELVAFPKP